jgi:ankyrin repeat protein
LPTAPLPEQPNIGQLRTQARELQRAVRSGDPAALALVAEHHPKPPAAAAFPLSAAQTVVARRHRFAGWARLVRHVEVINARSWTLPKPPDDEGLADRFLRLACLNFTDDDPARRAGAAALLARHPHLPATALAVAAACADAGQVRRHLAADPDAATRRCGPFGWSPLMYQAYARHDPEPRRDATLETARLLLDAGADPDDGRFFLGLPTPFTVLTGVFAGDGNGRPAHRHAVAFARTLLEAGADPNDGQTLYNRMFGTDDDHLVVLFAYGLGTGGDGTWYRLLGDQLESPEVMLRSLLDWAVSHDQRDRVALLAANGVDVVRPIRVRRRSTGARRTPVEVALLNGHRELAERLLALGAAPPRLDPVESYVAAVLAGDEEALAATPPDVVEQAREARPGLVVWAASLGRTAAVERLVAAGFDVNALGRADTPVEQPWQTALHTAAGDGDLALAERLIALGADPSLRDRHHRATALGWAAHFGHRPLIDLLTPLTADG